MRRSRMNMLGVFVAVAQITAPPGWPDLDPVIPPPKLKERRGRGNQGDHRKTLIKLDESPDHRAHNAAIEAKRQAKLARRKTKR